MPIAGETAASSPPPSSVAEGWLSELFREHHSRVLAAAFRVTGSAADAEDVLQTVFLRLATRRRGEEPEAESSAYLKRAAVNAAIDLLRSRRRAPTTGLGERELAIDDGGDPEADSRLRELERRLRRALAEESPRGAEIFALRCFEGCDYDQIAGLVGTSRAVVAVTLHRVRARLKRKLGE